VGSAGQLAGTMMGGTLVQAFGFTTLYIVCAIFTMASGICFLALRHSTSKLVETHASAD
jgi:predicted MFS family arabinose efflux permease